MSASRDILVALVSIFCLGGIANAAEQSPASNAPEVIFVCEHGSAKSVIAASYFNKIAAQRGLHYRAVSRGMTPDAALQGATLAGLNKDQIDTTSMTPQKLTADTASGAVRVVAINIANEPSYLKNERLLEWDDVPPVSKDYEASRDVMIKKINLLIDGIEASKR